MRPALCIIVPVLNEAENLAALLLHLQPLRRRGARVVVVDGGSTDDSLALARANSDLALLAPRGRAAQMNAGAAACPADVLCSCMPTPACRRTPMCWCGARPWAPLHGAASTSGSPAITACCAGSAR